MKICGIIRPNSIKIVAELDNYDLTEEAMKEILRLWNLKAIPEMAWIDTTESITFETDSYPLEKIKESLKDTLGENNATLGELEQFTIVANSLANLIEEAIDELKGAPLTINVNMGSWLEKPAGYFKEMDDV